MLFDNRDVEHQCNFLKNHMQRLLLFIIRVFFGSKYFLGNIRHINIYWSSLVPGEETILSSGHQIIKSRWTDIHLAAGRNVSCGHYISILKQSKYFTNRFPCISINLFNTILVSNNITNLIGLLCRFLDYNTYIMHFAFAYYFKDVKT